MTDHVPDAHRPMPAEVPLALKSNLGLGSNAEMYKCACIEYI